MVDGEGADEAVGDRISDAVAHTAQQTATSLARAPAPVAAKARTEASHSQQLRVPTAPGTGFAAVVARKPPRSGRTYQKSRYWAPPTRYWAPPTRYWAPTTRYWAPPVPRRLGNDAGLNTEEW